MLCWDDLQLLSCSQHKLGRSEACVPVPVLLGFGFTSCRKGVCCLLASYLYPTQATDKGHMIARLPKRQTGIELTVPSMLANCCVLTAWLLACCHHLWDRTQGLSERSCTSRTCMPEALLL